MRLCIFAVVSVALAGCSSGSQVTWPELHAVKGTLTQGGKPVTGGNLMFRMEGGSADYLVSGTVGADGSFALQTSHAQERGGTRKPGAPAGKYRVMYAPTGGDQTTGGGVDPIDFPQPVTIEARDNDLKLELPKKK